MRGIRRIVCVSLTLTALSAITVRFAAAPSASSVQDGETGRISHVLLLSIDGMHALDFENCVSLGTCPHLAELATTGVTYPRTSTSRPSDSFPGLMALVTGGTPKIVGAYYDVAYDRVLAPPLMDTGNGLVHGPCIPGVANGTRTEYEEGVDLNQSFLNGIGPDGPYSTTDGGVLSIDPRKLPRDPFAACAPVYPWNFIRTNTIYGVLHAARGRTAWADKHAVYAAVSGPTGTAEASNVDDYYAPDVNADVIALPGVTTATGLSCGAIPDPNGGAWVDSFQNIQCYDQLKVNAVLNWIRGRTHLGDRRAAVPVLFGMNFQAVSVGQKLIESGLAGGYVDAAGTLSSPMQTEVAFVDAAIGQMIDELHGRGLFESTAIIVTAKHGQSPVDPNRFRPIPGHSGDNGRPPRSCWPRCFRPRKPLASGRLKTTSRCCGSRSQATGRLPSMCWNAMPPRRASAKSSTVRPSKRCSTDLVSRPTAAIHARRTSSSSRRRA